MVSDIGKVVDRVVRSIIKANIDQTRLLDQLVYYRSLVIVLRDSLVGEYGLSKQAVKVYRDASRVVDLFSYAKHLTLIISDIGKTTDRLAKLLLKVEVDALRTLDRVTKYLGKTILLRDMLAGEFIISKQYGISKMDVAKMKEIVAKIGYTLTGEDARRVYVLTPEYWELIDTILPIDHNVKVSASKKLLDKFKQILSRLQQ